MSSVNQTFQSAPAGKRVILASVFSVVAFLITMVVDLRVAVPSFGWMPVSKKVALALTPFLTAMVGGFLFLRQRSLVAQIAIADDVLVLGKKRYPLQGATEVVRDSAVLKRAFRRCGNGGLGAITGSFKSKKYGKFYAFMTGTENAVVIRWPDTAVAVSPLDTEFFILSARKAAGLA
jgi:Bacterial PH domain